MPQRVLSASMIVLHKHDLSLQVARLQPERGAKSGQANIEHSFPPSQPVLLFGPFTQIEVFFLDRMRGEA